MIDSYWISPLRLWNVERASAVLLHRMEAPKVSNLDVNNFVWRMKVKDLEQQKQRLVEQVSNKTPLSPDLNLKQRTEKFAFSVDQTCYFSRFWQRLRVPLFAWRHLHLFPRLAVVTCFPALDTWHRWHVFPAQLAGCKILSMMWLVHWVFERFTFLLANYVINLVLLSVIYTLSVKFLPCYILIFWLGVRSGKAISNKGKRVYGLQGTTVDKTWSKTWVWDQSFENGKGI